MAQSIEECCDQIQDCPGKVRNNVLARYRQRLKLCLAVTNSIGNHTFACKMYSSQLHSETIDRLCRPLKTDLHHGAEAGFYMRMILATAQDLQRARKEQLDRLEPRTLHLFRVLGVLDAIGYCMYKDWASYRVWAAYEIDRRQQEAEKSFASVDKSQP